MNLRTSVTTFVAFSALLNTIKGLDDVYYKDEVIAVGEKLEKQLSLRLSEKEIKKSKEKIYNYFNYLFKNPTENMNKIINENLDIEEKYKKNYVTIELYLNFIEFKCDKVLKKGDFLYKIIFNYLEKLIKEIFY